MIAVIDFPKMLKMVFLGTLFIALSQSFRINRRQPNTQLSREMFNLMLRDFKTNSDNEQRMRILVLGGTGFVGKSVVEEAADQGIEVCSLSRRGIPKECKNIDSVTWLAGDVSNSSVIEDAIKRYGPFDACVHAIGILLDNDSGLSSLNQYASGSGSVPGSSSTYDTVTRKTAFNAIETFSSLSKSSSSSSLFPFIFISAAEAGWTWKVPVEWLERYLRAKRAVEDKLLNTPGLRPVIFRPSLIWTWDKPEALISVAPFTVASIFLPFIDRPVMIKSLVKSILRSIEREDVSGIKRFPDIEELSQT
mmetsp:Transcript_8305/g.8463  ORF Transcript_8305/g.8463 Transcript_8305/m.8463 type:complete len:306 (+) Transcript_8305:166-1083(+)